MSAASEFYETELRVFRVPGVFLFVVISVLGNFNTNRSIVTGDVKYGIKIPNVSCFLFIILASGVYRSVPTSLCVSHSYLSITHDSLFMP